MIVAFSPKTALRASTSDGLNLIPPQPTPQALAVLLDARPGLGLVGPADLVDGRGHEGVGHECAPLSGRWPTPAGVDPRLGPIDAAKLKAEEAEKAGHQRTAGQLYFRATNYLAQSERMLSKSDPNRVPTYRRILELAQKSFDLRDPRVSRVEIPYQGTTLPAYFSAAPATEQGPAPVMIMFNGLDSTKEHMANRSSTPASLRSRFVTRSWPRKQTCSTRNTCRRSGWRTTAGRSSDA